MVGRTPINGWRNGWIDECTNNATNVRTKEPTNLLFHVVVMLKYNHNPQNNVIKATKGKLARIDINSLSRCPMSQY